MTCKTICGRAVVDRADFLNYVRGTIASFTVEDMPQSAPVADTSSCATALRRLLQGESVYLCRGRTADGAPVAVSYLRYDGRVYREYRLREFREETRCAR